MRILRADQVVSSLVEARSLLVPQCEETVRILQFPANS